MMKHLIRIPKLAATAAKRFRLSKKLEISIVSRNYTQKRRKSDTRSSLGNLSDSAIAVLWPPPFASPILSMQEISLAAICNIELYGVPCVWPLSLARGKRDNDATTKNMAGAGGRKQDENVTIDNALE